MTYVKQTWSTGQVITAEKLNHMESGIEAVEAEIPTDAYVKPSSGIPATDLATAVQTSLGKANGAIPAPSSPASGDVLKYNGSAWIADESDGLSSGIKQALLNCFAHVAWTDAYGQDYYDALENALYPPADLVSISAVYTQSGTVYDTDSLDDLKDDLVVTATYSDSSTATVTAYTLSGTLTIGTSTITVTYGGKATSFTVTVTGVTSISAVYTQSGTVYDSDTLDSLKTDLAVTANYSDTTTQPIASADYTLSGTLAEGTSTITVSYNGMTTTFTVTVTEDPNITVEWSATHEFTFDANGEVVSGSQYVSDFIAIEADTYLLSDTTSNWYQVCFYDSEKNFVRKYSNNATKPYYLDTDAGYMRIEVFPPSGYTIPSACFSVQKLGRSWTYNKASFSTSDGSLGGGNNRCKFAYIPVTANTSYTRSAIGNLTVTYMAIFEYDSNHAFIKRTEKASGSNTVTVTSTTAYARIQGYAPDATAQTNMDEQVSFAQS